VSKYYFKVLHAFEFDFILALLINVIEECGFVCFVVCHLFKFNLQENCELCWCQL
jgi:hypothetical protein